MLPYTVNIRLSARTLTGALSAQNRGAVDWGWQGLIAYGCQSLVLVIDSNTAQTIQVLERHKTNVVKVKWAKENYHHNIGSPYSLRLASADATGKIIVWDVATGTVRCEIQEHTKPIQDMQWLWNQDASRDLLLAVHPPNYIVLWNADTGTKLWKKSYAENILSFSFDPFDPSHLTYASQVGLGAVLAQKRKGVEHPILYASRKLLPREQNYATVEKEALAVKWAVEYLRYYLWGNKFHLITDHAPANMA